MSSAIYGGTTVEVNDEGFFEDPGKWTEAMAPEIAKAQGIDVLTEHHWQVIKFMRAEYIEKGSGRPFGSSARPLASRSRSSTSCFRRVQPRQLPRSPEFPSRVAASRRASGIRSNRKVPMSDPIEKVSIIVSKGSLEGVYPALIMANGARAEGSKPICSSRSSDLMSSIARQSTTSRWPPSAIPGCTLPRSPEAYPACRR